MDLTCYKVSDFAHPLVPGKVDRSWMDEIAGRHAYRCLPLNMANVSGWQILCPVGFSAHWNGDITKEAISLKCDDPDFPLEHLAASHFCYGILTLHPNYLFRTTEGWSIWAMGPPNVLKDKISPMAGLIETDWLPYPFTMNWKFTRPGTIRFEKGEPFCFITLVQPKALESVEPVIRHIDSNQALKAEYEAWKDARSAFNAKIDSRDPVALREAWQRHYMKGRYPDGTLVTADHTNRRRLSTPIEE